jgi:hypothetical protein
VSNSTTTILFGFQVPSAIHNSPPRTKNLPEYFLSILGVSAKYSLIFSESFISTLAIKYAGVYFIFLLYKYLH